MTWGESVDANGHATETGRSPQPWCRYAATCYKSRRPLHMVEPPYGSPYVDGCPMDEDSCRSALLVSGRMPYEATREDRRAEEALKGWRTCCRCGTWFRYRHGNERYCSDACRADVLTKKRWAERNREKLREYQREYQRKHDGKGKA